MIENITYQWNSLPQRLQYVKSKTKIKYTRQERNDAQIPLMKSYEK